MIYDYALVSYYTRITDATAYSAPGLFEKGEKTVPRFLPFVDFAFYQKRKQRNSLCIYTFVLSGRFEKKRDSTLFDFERTTEIYALAIPSV